MADLFSSTCPATVDLFLDETFLVVRPDVRGIHEVLKTDTYELVAVPKKNGRGVVRKKMKRVARMFDIYEEHEVKHLRSMHQGFPHNKSCVYVETGVKHLRTHHGFIRDVIAKLDELKIAWQLHDGRMPFPAPQLELMHGFRFSQEDLLGAALKQNTSGLIGAPTRWGKTTLLLNTIRAFPGLRTVVAVPGVDLVDQTYRDLKAKLEDRDVRMVHGAVTVKDQGPDVTVCSFDSLDKMDTAMTRLLLVDEPHACVTDTRTDKIIAFDRARKYGYGATLEGRFDGRDPLIKGILGPVLAERTYREAVAEGAIAPIVIIAVNMPVAHSNAYNRDIAYKIALWENETVLNILRWLLPLKDGSSHVFPAEWQRLAFISNEKQLEFIKSRLSADVDFVTAMAKQMTGKERKERMERLKTSQDTVCFATHIYAQGVTFSDLRVMINLEGGGASTKALQKPGRVAELRPGKKCGVVVDFNFYATPAQYAAHPDSQMWALTRESRARLNAYAEKGFEIRHINNTSELVAATRDLI